MHSEKVNNLYTIRYCSLDNIKVNKFILKAEMDMNLVLDISGNDLKEAIIKFNNQMEIGNLFFSLRT